MPKEIMTLIFTNIDNSLNLGQREFNKKKKLTINFYIFPMHE